MNGETQQEHRVPEPQGDTLVDLGKNSDAPSLSSHSFHSIPRRPVDTASLTQAGAASGLREGCVAGCIATLSWDFSEEGLTRKLGRIRRVEARTAVDHDRFAVHRVLGLPSPTAASFPKNFTLLVFLSQPFPPF